MHAFVEDAIAVLDDAEVDSCPVAGWSIGVNTQFELATLFPQRVSGLFAVAGVPGGTFASMLAPLMVPRFARKALTLNVARGLRTVGRVVSPVSTRLPISGATAGMLRYSGFMTRRADNAVVKEAVREFMTTDVTGTCTWPSRLPGIRESRCPASRCRPPSSPAGTTSFASAKDMATAARRIERATYTELPGSHFVQMDHPELVHAELLHLLSRI